LFTVNRIPAVFTRRKPGVAIGFSAIARSVLTPYQSGAVRRPGVLLQMVFDIVLKQ
jgi:hypothetical protein